MKYLKQYSFLILFSVSLLTASPFMLKNILDTSSSKDDPFTSPNDFTEDDTMDEDISNTLTDIVENTTAKGTEELSAIPSTENTTFEIPEASEPEMTDPEPPEPEPSEPKPTPQPSISENMFFEADWSYFDDALFIGDSRTVGIRDYSGITNATFFATTGMSVYNVLSTTVSINPYGKVTLDELLSAGTYGKVYVMLGINELGYNFNKTVDRYASLITHIQEAAPNAIIYVMGNLHVSQKRSDTDDIFNNANINRFNSAIAVLENRTSIFYLDVNVLFDDANGNLSTEYTYDNSHVLGKYYAVWGDWLRCHATISQP